MRKIVEFRKLLGVTKETDLQEIKSVYRNLMKECHPDKFLDDHDKLQAEEKSKQIIEAYHFLVSISPETHEKSLEEYTKTITSAGILDYEYKSQILKITFGDGSKYEYFDVPKSLYTKMVNSDSVGRFVKRHIFNAFDFRNLNKNTVAE